MIERKIAAGLQKAREIAARVPSPVGRPFAAAAKGKTAEIYLYDAIGKDPWSDTGIDPQDVVKALAEVKGAEALDIHINSPGGLVFDGIAIFNAIRAFPGTKTVYVDGIAASIASVIALAGDRVVTNEGAMWMVHDPAGGVFTFGTADQIEDDARKTVNALRKVRETLLDIYVNATGRPLSEISAWMTAETWMTAAEAKERGFTHEVARAEPDEEEKPTPHHAAPPKKAAAAMNPTDVAEQARITRRRLANQFPGAGPGSQRPDQSGKPTSADPATAGKGKQP